MVAGSRNPISGRMVLTLAVFACVTLVGSSPAGTRERLSGPVPAHVLRVIDGDTIEVRAKIWLGQAVETRVRIVGIDAPELSSGCALERQLAKRAQTYLKTHIRGGDIILTDIEYGKYAGRVIARVRLPSGTDAAQSLLAAGLVRLYDGGRRRAWCG